MSIAELSEQEQIRRNSLAQLRERVAADLFLFTEFCDAHGGFFQNLIPAQMYENS